MAIRCVIAFLFLLAGLLLAVPCLAQPQAPDAEDSLGAPPQYAAMAQNIDRLLKEGKFAEALAICEQQYALAADDEARALFLRGKAEVLKVERSVKCIDVFKEVIARYPATKQASFARLGLGETYAWMGLIVGKPNEYFTLALPLLDQFVRENSTSPHCAKALWGMGMIYDRLKDAASALAVYEKASSSYATQSMAPACLERVVALRQQLGQWDQAITSARRYIQLYPDREESAAMQVSIGMSCVSKGDLAGAVLEFDRVPLLFPAASDQCAQAMLQKALVYKSMSQAGVAAQILKELLTAYPNEHAATLAKRTLEGLPAQ